MRRQAEGRQRGKRPRPFRRPRYETRRGDDPVAAAAVAARQLRASGRTLGILIAAAAHLRCRRPRAGTSVNSRPLQPSAFAGGCNYARVLPDCRSGSRPCRPGVLAVASAAPGGWFAGPAPGGREAAVAAILMISPASCRGRHHLRASALARAMLGTYSLDHAEQDWLGAAGPPFSPGGDSCRPATFRCGCASECWRSRYPTLLGPKVWVPTVIRL